MVIYHIDEVDKANIKADFTDDNLHRSSLFIPFLNRNESNTLCIIGQNPSKANNEVADKTLRYLERFIYDKMPEYSNIIMLNLYSRVDTEKSHVNDLERPSCNEKVASVIESNSNFLIVYGKLTNQGGYRFIEKSTELKNLLHEKNVFKIDIGSCFAPHPGNPKIHYSNYSHGITCYDFSDVA